MAQNKTFSAFGWSLLSLSIWILISSGFGIAHPDEIMQSIEPMMNFKCQRKANLPWEYQSENGIRSLFPWTLIFGMFDGFCKYGIILQRFVFIFLGYLILQMDNFRQIKLAPTFAFLYFTSRPYSNTLEWILLSLISHLVLSGEWKIKRLKSFIIGSLTTIGCFTRVTFPVFAGPVILYYLIKSQKTDIRGRVSWLAFSGVLSAAAVIVFDSIYYGKLSIENATNIYSISSSNFTITPLNNFLYNSKTKNLSNHGLHPRFTHVLINAPLMFGSMWWRFLAGISKWRAFSSIQILNLSVIITSFGILSIFPHQEPRFLLPLLQPLSQFLDDPLVASVGFKRSLLYDITDYLQIILSIFFGFFHQSGVVPCIRNTNSTCLIFWKTYPAGETLASSNNQHIEYYYGEDPNDLINIYNSLENCKLIVPDWLIYRLDKHSVKTNNYCHSGFHIGLDDLPTIWAQITHQKPLEFKLKSISVVK